MFGRFFFHAWDLPSRHSFIRDTRSVKGSKEFWGSRCGSRARARGWVWGFWQKPKVVRCVECVFLWWELLVFAILLLFLLSLTLRLLSVSFNVPIPLFRDGVLFWDATSNLLLCTRAQSNTLSWCTYAVNNVSKRTIKISHPSTFTHHQQSSFIPFAASQPHLGCFGSSYPAGDGFWGKPPSWQRQFGQPILWHQGSIPRKNSTLELTPPPKDTKTRRTRRPS